MHSVNKLTSKLLIFLFIKYLMIENYVVLSYEMIYRQEWNAQPPKHITKMDDHVPFVIIHHSEAPKHCLTTDKCIEAVKSFQNYHINTKKWDDIGYNFLIGGDSKVYEGRGWSVVGAHAPNYNNRSIGICFIGDFSHTTPSSNQLLVAKELIEYGTYNGYITTKYILYGHRQVRATNCPGDALYNKIKTWSHWKEK